MQTAHPIETTAHGLRENPRHRFKGSGTLSTPGSRDAYAGSIVDLSIGGCRLQFSESVEWPVGTVVEINLQSSYLALRTLGAIRHSSAWGTLIGFEFQGLSARGAAQIREQLRDLETVMEAGFAARRVTAHSA